MHSKKAIEISLTTVLGLAVAAIVLVFVIIPVLGKLYAFLVPKPDYTSEQAFNRVTYMLGSSEEGSIQIPVQLSPDFKITYDDPGCAKGCVCLCSSQGCARKVYKKTCYKEEPIFYEGGASTGIGAITYIYISRTSKGFQIPSCSYYQTNETSCRADNNLKCIYIYPNKAFFDSRTGYCTGCSAIKSCSDYAYSQGECQANSCGISGGCLWDVSKNICEPGIPLPSSPVQREEYSEKAGCAWENNVFVCKSCLKEDCSNYDVFVCSACSSVCRAIPSGADYKCEPLP
ncbi:hypothetical protein KY308_02165 [Candidatus Woesearchaeota archaeon]|nr:hypothetical protein [Candidatus Woesearchaeota archaeon]